jgi:hypothetical protein
MPLTVKLFSACLVLYLPTQKIMLVLENNNLYTEKQTNKRTNGRDIDLCTNVKKGEKSIQAGAPLERRGVVLPRGGTISQRGFLICCEGVM